VWLARVGLPSSNGALHGSMPTSYENVAGKLTQLGCNRGMASFDARMAPFRAWLAERQTAPQPWHLFYGTLVAAALARGGYRDEAIGRTVADRLDALHAFARLKRYDLYIPQDTHPGFPDAFRGKPLISPEISGPAVLRIPIIEDILLLDAWYDGLDAADRARANVVVAYILDPAYQSLPQGYGVVKGDGRRYYSHGWSVHLAGYAGFGDMGWEQATLVPRLELLARFPAAWSHGYFSAVLAHLDTFRTPQGSWAFPREYLRDRPGYWVSGYLLGMEEDRRDKKAIQLESTFRMLRIRRLAGVRA
jgi:hypothetical protein